MGGRGSAGNRTRAGNAEGTASKVKSVREIMKELEKKSRSGWVNIADIRDQLHGDREHQDDLLKDFARQSDVNITPESNQKVLSHRDRAGALWYGGQWKHYFKFD